MKIKTSKVIHCRLFRIQILANNMVTDRILWPTDAVRIYEASIEVIQKIGDKLYRHCITCNITFDLWKYDSLKAAGHERCKVRKLTFDETLMAIQKCKTDGCFR